MRNSRPQPLESLFSDTRQLQQIQRQASVLNKLNRAVRALLPAPLRQGCRVANYRHGVLILEVASGSQQLRLRYAQGELLSALRGEILPSLASIDIRINPQLMLDRIENRQNDPSGSSQQEGNRTKRQLSHDSAERLRAVAEHGSPQLRQRLYHLASLAGESASDTDDKERSG
ncbi:MAG: DUF721 domain-containing protein [Enterobacteriaceae bacterium]